jgi:hypothetical protein
VKPTGTAVAATLSVATLSVATLSVAETPASRFATGGAATLRACDDPFGRVG